MSKQTAVILLGFFMALVPFLGIPSSWRTPILIVSGLLIAALGFLLRLERRSRDARRGLPYMENGHADNEETSQEPAEARVAQL